MYTPSTEEIKMAIERIAIEANSDRNDGWIKQAHRNQLKEIAKTILEVLDK